MSPATQELYRKAVKKTLAKTPSVQKEGWDILGKLNRFFNGTKNKLYQASSTIHNAKDTAQKAYYTLKEVKDVALPVINYLNALFAPNPAAAIPAGFNAADNFVI